MNLITGCSSLIGLLIGIRLYCIYFVWRKCKNKKSMKDKTVIITGSNSGIGKETAKELVLRGATVIMACRNQDKTMQSINDIKNKVNNNGKLIYKHIDLTSFDSIKKFAHDINNYDKPINVLINNAGIFKCPFELTEDGFETQFQVNHLSHALLSMLLMPKLEDSAIRTNSKSKIIMLTSTLYVKGTINDDDFKKNCASGANYDGLKAYCNSKLANIHFARELSKLNANKPVDVYLVSPGIVWTNLSRYVKMSWWKMMLLSPMALILLRTPNQGCQTVVNCAIDDSLKSGNLYRNCRNYSEHENKSWKKILDDSDLSQKIYKMTLDIISDYLK